MNDAAGSDYAVMVAKAATRVFFFVICIILSYVQMICEVAYSIHAYAVADRLMLWSVHFITVLLVLCLTSIC